MNNPYLDEFKEIITPKHPLDTNYLIDIYTNRTNLIRKYAWAIPNAEAIEMIFKYSPMIELGAMNGYWASLIEQAGGKVHALDIFPTSTYHEVHYGTPDDLKKLSDPTLLLCWPPYANPMAASALVNFTGDTIIYVGEGMGGCTADDTFHTLLDSKYQLVEFCDIPQWPGLNDQLMVFRKKK